MPTVIHDRPAVVETGSGAGALVATVVLVVLGILFFLYALPAIRGNNDVQINVPDNVEVNP
jgi:hypothetical protein